MSKDQAADTPEVDKLLDRLVYGPILPDGTRPEGYALRNFNAWWGPAAATAEQRAAAVNAALEQTDREDCADGR